MMESNIGDYLTGILSLPPVNGDDTSAPFIAGAGVDSVQPSLATGVSSSVGSAISDITGAPVLGTAGPDAQPATVPFVAGATGAAVQVAQYAGIALLGIVLLGIGLWILVSPSAPRVVEAAAGV